MSHTSTILIADDDEGVRDILESLLIRYGYKLAFAVDGRQAVEKATEMAPNLDLVILDLMMPEMDGFEVCRYLRSDSALAEIPIIMVTAMDDNQSRLQGLEAGADDFISKPFSYAELRARVQTIIRLNRYRRLLAERTKFDWVVEQANDGYVILDEAEQILYANPRARLYLDIPVEELEKLPPFLVVAGKQYNCHPEDAWAIWPDHPETIFKTPRYLVQPETSTANAFWLQVDNLELPAGDRGRWMIQLRDVTNQMALQRDMWEFQAMVSHKLRTPLAGVVGGLSLLDNKDFRHQMNEEQADMFEMVTDSAKRLQNAIQDILQYMGTSALTHPEISFNLAQLQPLIEQVNRQLELLKPVTVDNRSQLEEAQLSLSERGLELILHEILENSKKFHPQQNPTVQVIIAPVDNDRIKIQLYDDGLTLSAEQISQAWTPYYQGDKYFTGETSGMGLGLSRVANLVWGVGGQCRIFNREPGPGVGIEIILPLLPWPDESEFEFDLIDDV